MVVQVCLYVLPSTNKLSSLVYVSDLSPLVVLVSYLSYLVSYLRRILSYIVVFSSVDPRPLSIVCCISPSLFVVLPDYYYCPLTLVIVLRRIAEVSEVFRTHRGAFGTICEHSATSFHIPLFVLSSSLVVFWCCVIDFGGFSAQVSQIGDREVPHPSASTSHTPHINGQEISELQAKHC